MQYETWLEAADKVYQYEEAWAAGAPRRIMEGVQALQAWLGTEEGMAAQIFLDSVAGDMFITGYEDSDVSKRYLLTPAGLELSNRNTAYKHPPAC